jgi:cationic peptide transport system ATP-binding protein
MTDSIALFSVNDITKTFKDKSNWFKKGKDVVIGPVSFEMHRGETIALVGDAGSGKSTIARILSGAESPDSGQLFLGDDVVDWNDSKFFCQNIRMIFQDAQKSLNPTVRIGDQLEQPLIFNTRLNKADREKRINDALRKVGLLPEHANYYPHMFSGGQAQRIGIARALILDPQVVIIDEALAPLDPSLRAQVINLLLELQETLQLTYLLISHQISLVRYLSDRIIIMDKGQIIESGDIDEVFDSPQSPKTEKLLMSLDM